MAWQHPGSVPAVPGGGLKTELAEKPGVRNPGALAAAIGRRIAAKGGK